MYDPKSMILNDFDFLTFLLVLPWGLYFISSEMLVSIELTLTFISGLGNVLIA